MSSYLPDSQIIWPLQIVSICCINIPSHLFFDHVCMIKVKCSHSEAIHYNLCPLCLGSYYTCSCFTESSSSESDMRLFTNPFHRWDWDYEGKLIHHA